MYFSPMERAITLEAWARVDAKLTEQVRVGRGRLGSDTACCGHMHVERGCVWVMAAYTSRDTAASPLTGSGVSSDIDSHSSVQAGETQGAADVLGLDGLQQRRMLPDIPSELPCFHRSRGSSTACLLGAACERAQARMLARTSSLLACMVAWGLSGCKAGRGQGRKCTPVAVITLSVHPGMLARRRCAGGAGPGPGGQARGGAGAGPARAP